MLRSPRESPDPLALAPSFVILLGLGAALIADSFGAAPPFSAFIAVIVSAAWILTGSERAVPQWTAAFVLILLLTLIAASFILYRMNRRIAVPASISTESKVLLNREWGRSRALLLDTHYGRMVAYLPPDQAPPAGALLRLRGAVFDLERSGGGGFSEFHFWRGKGARKKVILLNSYVAGEPAGMFRWRGLLERRIREGLPRRTAAYMLALTLGVRTAELSELHRYAGTLHLLAVSGFHVGVVAGLASLLLRRGLKKIIGVSAVAWFYVLLAGAPPGGVRAALMLQIYMLSLLLGRPSSGFNNVSFAGVLLLLHNPWNFFDIGWRLSMLAALFLSAFGTAMVRSWKTASAASILVWLVTAPLVAVSFNEVPLAGLFINIFAVPLFAFIFPLILLLSLPSLVGFACGGYIAFMSEYMLGLWEICSRALSCLIPWSIGYSWSLFILAAAIFCAAVLFASGYSKIKTTMGAIFLPFFLLLLT